MDEKQLFFKVKKTIFEGIESRTFTKVEMGSKIHFDQMSEEDIKEIKDFVIDRIAKEVNVYPGNVIEITEEEFNREKDE